VGRPGRRSGTHVGAPRLGVTESQVLLAYKGLHGHDQDWANLIARYGGMVWR
jgi:hypothetical protein